jgi:molecular chaperone DnaK (HSP70)
MAGDWRLAIDIGSAFTAAAIAEDGQITDLTFGGSTVLPAVVALGAGGQVLIGQSALARAEADPGSALRMPRRAMAAGAKVRLGGRTFLVADLLASVVDCVCSEAIRQQSGRPPGEVVVCHPVQWTEAELSEIIGVGVGAVSFVPEPVATARHYLAGCPAVGCAHDGLPNLPGDAVLAVCDFGAGLDVTLVRGEAGRLEIVGPPGGDADLGGDDLDERLAELVADRAYQADARAWDALASASPPAPGLALLRSCVTAAREDLSRLTHATVAVPGYGSPFRITRLEFEAAVRPELERAVAAIEAAVHRASVAAFLLAGAVSRTPAFSDVLAGHFGKLPETTKNPKATVTHGALLSATGLAMQQQYLILASDDPDWLNTT